MPYFDEFMSKVKENKIIGFNYHSTHHCPFSKSKFNLYEA